MGKGKFIKGRLLLKGSGVEYVMAFTPPPMKMESIEISDLEGNSYLLDDTRYQDPTATFKLGAPLAPAKMGQLQNGADLITLTSMAVYAITGGATATKKGSTLIVLAQPGGWEDSEQTPGDGGEIEVTYVPKSVQLLDSDTGAEVFFYDYFTHVKRINGQDVGQDTRKLLGYS